MKESKFSFIDLFAGIGGFRLALESVGGECVGFSEIAPDAISSYCANYGESPSSNLGDITKLDTLPHHDFMTAGVPCQSWSIAGKNLGFDDSRGQLWNDALYLLKASLPKAFIFENVKGLADPRNRNALEFILNQIKASGYHAAYYLLNAYDYGVPQNRIRIYIIGFKDKLYFDRFSLPKKNPGKTTLKDVIAGPLSKKNPSSTGRKGQSISVNESGYNDYFLFNDLRSGDTTIHSWDLIDTTKKEKHICLLILQNRRKKKYGPLDGNPLSLEHLADLDSTITQADIEHLIQKSILKAVKYKFIIDPSALKKKSSWAKGLANYNLSDVNVDVLKNDKFFKIAKINVSSMLEELEAEDLAKCTEIRYEFKNTKISTGLNGINRIFLPDSRLYPTLVASDTNDYIAEFGVSGKDAIEYKDNFLKYIYSTGSFRQIDKSEACAIQGFPKDFILPQARPRWMKLIGNSVAVTLIRQLAQSVVATGVFNENDYTPTTKHKNFSFSQPSLFDFQ